MAFRFCPKCGTENTESDPFCSNCGHGVTVRESSDTDNSINMNAEERISQEVDSSNNVIVFDPVAKLAMFFSYTKHISEIKDRKFRKKLKANFPACDIKQIGLTDYGERLLFCTFIYLEVLRRGSEFREKFSCEKNEFCEKTIADIHDRIFADENSTVPIVECTGNELDFNSSADCSLDIEEHNLTDMVYFLSMLILAMDEIEGPLAMERPTWWPDELDQHKVLHLTAAFNKNAMGCSKFVSSLDGYINEEMYLRRWLFGPLNMHEYLGDTLVAD